MRAARKTLRFQRREAHARRRRHGGRARATRSPCAGRAEPTPRARSGLRLAGHRRDRGRSWRRPRGAPAEASRSARRRAALLRKPSHAVGRARPPVGTPRRIVGGFWPRREAQRTAGYFSAPPARPPAERRAPRIAPSRLRATLGAGERSPPSSTTRSSSASSSRAARRRSAPSAASPSVKGTPPVGPPRTVAPALRCRR